MPIDFSDKDKQILLGHARRILETTLLHGEPAKEKCPLPKYLEKFGLFISLRKRQELRGCIGTIQPILSIWEAITENTIAAARDDIRFTPLSFRELNEIKIEISVLTKPEECLLEEIKINDGVILQQTEYKATYLPQVWEKIPDKKIFLSSLCQKAGLESNCYLDKSTKFSKYHTIVFTE